MKNVFAIVAAVVFGLFFVCERGNCQAFPTPDGSFEHAFQNVASQEATGIDLYVKPDKQPDTKPDKPDKPEPDRRQVTAKEYPALFQEARQKGVIVIFGATWCGWCKIQRAAIPDDYRVLYVETDIDPKYRKLMTKWEVVPKVGKKEAPTYPTMVLAANGVPIKHWYGFKPWRVFEDDMKKAKKDEDQSKGIRVDHGGNRGGGQPSRRRQWRRTYTPRYGRWSRR